MPDYDATLKILRQGTGSSTVVSRLLGGMEVARWLNVELPRVNVPRVDMLGEITTGSDGLALLNSQYPGDVVLAILMRWLDQLEAVREILSRVKQLPEQKLRDPMAQPSIISWLRRLRDTFREEARKMAITADFRADELFGAFIAQGRGGAKGGGPAARGPDRDS